MATAIKIVVIAVVLALDVFAVSIGVGVRGVSPVQRLRIGMAFAGAEVTMNLIGAGIGVVAGKLLGGVSGYIGFIALLGLGIYMIVQSLRGGSAPALDMSKGWGLLVAALSISLDSLGIGFSILYIGVPLVLTLCVIAAVSAGAAALGTGIGGSVGERVGARAELLSGGLLALTGIVFILLKALDLG